MPIPDFTAFNPGYKDAIKGRRSAERRMPSTVRAARTRKRIQRDALAFRRFTAALATPVATSIGSAPEPGFPRQAKAKVFCPPSPFWLSPLVLAFAIGRG